MKFRKKPIVIEAIQFTGDNSQQVIDFITEGGGSYLYDGRNLFGGYDRISIYTLEGEMRVAIGDWVIRGINGEFYPCKPDIFAASYEPADGPNQ